MVKIKRKRSKELDQSQVLDQDQTRELVQRQSKMFQM